MRKIGECVKIYAGHLCTFCFTKSVLYTGNIGKTSGIPVALPGTHWYYWAKLYLQLTDFTMQQTCMVN